MATILDTHPRDARRRTDRHPALWRRLWLIGTVLFSLLLYYFIGIDQGATSVFGNNMHIHEFVHDARHFLGFPCH